MNLALITHNVMPGDGQSRVGYEIARHALRRGVKVWLLADHVVEDLKLMGATWIPVRPRLRRLHLLKGWEFTRRANAALSRMVGALDIVQGFGFVVTQPHTVSNCQFVHRSWLRSPAHIIRQRHDLYGAYQWLHSCLNALWERAAYRQAHIVVASSGLIRQQLIEIGVPQERIRVIHNGVDTREFHPGTGDRGALGLPEDVPLALFVGDIRLNRKNLDTTLKALARVPCAHLAVVGSVERSPYPEMAACLGLAGRVHFLGFRRDIPQIMRAADLFVFPSRYEACSLVLLEASASGLPVLTARTAGGAELITSDCGIVLDDPNDAEGLASALQLLLEDPRRRADMGQAARAMAERHTWERTAEAHLQLYQEIAR